MPPKRSRARRTPQNEEPRNEPGVERRESQEPQLEQPRMGLERRKIQEPELDRPQFALERRKIQEPELDRPQFALERAPAPVPQRPELVVSENPTDSDVDTPRPITDEGHSIEIPVAQPLASEIEDDNGEQYIDLSDLEIMPGLLGPVDDEDGVHEDLVLDSDDEGYDAGRVESADEDEDDLEAAALESEYSLPSSNEDSESTSPS